MSNKNPEIDYGDWTDGNNFHFDQRLKGYWFNLPGIIVSYNKNTKRAVVRPAINIELTDNTTVQQSSIVNVPVVWPGGGGFTLLAPLPPGTPVVLHFSQRGIVQFKEVFAEANPGSNFFSKADAMIVPGFGNINGVTPAKDDGLCLQSENGVNFVSIEDGIVTVETDGDVNVNCDKLTGTVAATAEIACPEVTITGNLTVTGTIDALSIATAGATMSAAGAIVGSSIETDAGIDLDGHVHGEVETGLDDTGAAK